MPQSRVTAESVAHLAALARIDIPGAELDHYAEQLGVILDAVAEISAVATDHVPATSHPIPLRNVSRPDTPIRSLTAAAALSEAPVAQDGRFRVPRILDDQ